MLSEAVSYRFESYRLVSFNNGEALDHKDLSLSETGVVPPR